MALSIRTATNVDHGTACGVRYATRESNDAFSFWKLPEDWRPALEESIASSEAIAELFLREAYLPDDAHRTSTALRAYYHFKRLIPIALRHRLNSAAVCARAANEFPRWPCESALIELRHEWLADALETLGVNDGWHIAFWPDDFKCCIVLTHDVETREGFEQIESMADLEERWGFRSAWNLPLAQYKIDWNRVDELRARGFEFGAHGLSHDGRLFRSEQDFAKLSRRIEQIAQEHDLRGFRSPSTLRDPRLIAAMNFDFDSSFADTDPYEPQAGGTCSIFPFNLSNMIELPYTVPQDHTLLHLLRRNPVPLWVLKARWIAARGGMILTLTHPDYCGRQPKLGLYEELLRNLAGMESAWRALPSQVARWWRQRAHTDLRLVQGRPVIEGQADGRAVVRPLSEQFRTT